MKSLEKIQAMTDAQMGERLAHLQKRKERIDRHGLRLFAGAQALTILVAGIAAAATGGISLPFTAAGIAMTVECLGLGLAGAQKTSIDSEIWMLSEENKERVHQAQMTRLRAQAQAAVQAAAEKRNPPSPTAQELRGAFDNAIAAMEKGIDRDLAVRRPLKLKRAGNQAGA